LDKETLIVQQKTHKKKSRYNIYVFLVCLCLSTLIWLFIKLSKDYNIVVVVGIDYVNVPKDKFITKADTIFNFTVKANGLKLLSRKIPKKERIKVSLSDVSFKKNANNQYFGNVELQNYVENLISEKFPFVKKVEDISQKTVSLELDNAYSKKVPVKAVYSYTLEKQFFVCSPVNIEPDSVFVYGAKSKIEKIKYIETDSVAFGNLNKSLDKILILKDNGIFNYHLSHKNVQIHIPVEKFTEMELTVPILIPDLKSKKHIKIFPENTKITFIVALKDYFKVNAGMFKIFVDTVGMNNKTTLPVYIQEAPQYIKVNKISPDIVEFIKIK